MPFNYDDRKLLHSISDRLGESLDNDTLILIRLNDLLANVIQLRQSMEAMVEIMERLAVAEETEVRQLDRIVVTLTSP